MANTKLRCVFFLLAVSFMLSDRFVGGRRIGVMESKELFKHKGTVKTIKGKDGHIIDCVNIYQQPAFDHPLLKNHTIQMEPTSIPNVTNGEFYDAELFQGWLKNGECPQRTIPIRRAREDENYAPRTIRPVARLNSDYNRNHEYATVDIPSGHYYGGHASINVWNPKTYNKDVSIAQIWISAGPVNELNTIEAGWQVTWLDKEPKFFIYWTRDGYQQTGCYNLNCPGFVQAATRMPLYIAQKILQLNYVLYDMGNWWLKMHDQVIGYWPRSFFTDLAVGATQVSFGGEIYSVGQEGHHTSTQMGSGHFPSEGFGKASYFRNLQYMDGSGKFNDAKKGLTKIETKPSCYYVQIADNKNGAYGTHFYYGGPGYSPICP
ncbi:hypothetical protein SLA2020_414330 [Shorea laevis]